MNIINIIIMLIAAIIIKTVMKGDSNMFAGAFSIIGDMVFTLSIGIPIFTTIFADDFNSKAMQASIGFGLSRTKLVLCRFIELVVLSYLVMYAYVLIITLIGCIFGYGSAAGDMLFDFFKNFSGYSLVIICYAAIAMIAVYALQNATFGLVIYILLTSKVLGGILAGLSFVPFFAKHNINPSAIIASEIIIKILGGKVLYLIPLLIGYVVVPLFITITVFKKKELDF
ncbi:MAG: hypothetical protein K6D02_06540 [Lachnospiraceae bacterium]|nr:hypothetical protein [Lachnospiraceae bacterium]